MTDGVQLGSIAIQFRELLHINSSVCITVINTCVPCPLVADGVRLCSLPFLPLVPTDLSFLSVPFLALSVCGLVVRFRQVFM